MFGNRDSQMSFGALNNWLVRMTSSSVPDKTLSDLLTKLNIYTEVSNHCHFINLKMITKPLDLIFA